MIKNEILEINVCLDHLEHSRTDSISYQETVPVIVQNALN